MSEALKLLDAGLSVIPCDPETKRPAASVGQWGRFQKVRPTKEEVESLFVNGYAIAVVGGPVSGNLEIIDFDEEGLAKQWRDLLISWNCKTVYDKLIIEESQTKGRFHIIYRHRGKPEGNQKLATTADGKNRVETRGDGGYCIVSPSRGYKMVRGSWSTIPVLSSEEREVLLAAARTFDQSPPKLEKPAYDQETVWGDYNSRASIDEILIPLGWTRSGKDLWVRPGKERGMGHSATWNYQGRGLFHVFSSSTGLECRSYDLFGLYAWTHHGGDFKAATLAAAAAGYGKQPNQMVAETARPDRSWGSLDGIEPEEIRWLWKPFFPLGMVSLLYGDGGIGKSTASLKIATHVTTGEALPGQAPRSPGNVIILSAEDPPAQVIVPRLQAMGCDLSRIMAPNEFDEDGNPNPMILDDEGAEELAERAHEYQADLIVVDPVLAYFEAARDMNRGTDVRLWMRRLSNIARQAGAAVLLVHHVNKNSMAKAAHRAMGSADFVNASRSAVMAVQDPGDESNCALVHTKHNLSEKGASLGYTINPDGFSWTGESDLTPEVCATPPETKASPRHVAEARIWLESVLANGPMGSGELFEGAKAAGITREALFKAKRDCGDFRVSKMGMSGGWEWSLNISDRGWRDA